METEKLLEDMIVAAPSIVSDQWMIIGRQLATGSAGILDLLAIAPDGSLVLIELKRDLTPRDVVAQALEYASWVDALEPDTISQIYFRYSKGSDLQNDFQINFGQALPEETVNSSHQIVIVASALDRRSEKIVTYLSQRGVPINVLAFQVFEHEGTRFLSRTWLIDPAETQSASSAAPASQGQEPWNGEYYVSFGHDEERRWEDAVRWGFVSAGGGTWYSNTLRLLKAGDRVWVKVPGFGFVGVGRVRGPRVGAKDFIVNEGGEERPLSDVLNPNFYKHHPLDDVDRMEYFVPVDWQQTADLNNAVKEIGLFGNQNTVCAPKAQKWRHTIERLKQAFPDYDGPSARA